MTINYIPFPSGSNAIKGKGKDIKICFKATNCYDYNARVAKCLDTNTGLGFLMTAQQTQFYLSNGSSVNTQYCENSYIELEQEIYPVEDADSTHKNPDRFLLFWADGIPVGISVYPEGETFN
jgi:hypothetical protein